MIKIIDNFFNEHDLQNVQNFALTKAFYTPQYFNNTTEKNKQNYYGNRWELKNNVKLKQLFIKQSELKFKIKIKKIDDNSGIDQRNLDHFKPHQDSPDGIINIMIMIKGITAVTNGTVFYNRDKDNLQLDTHIGFRENRAILFPSDHWHSQHASDIPDMIRYSATLFIKDYEEV
jgi:hypothetical protein